MQIQIEKRQVGKPQPCFIIAEIGQNHDGSLGLAHAYIDAAAEAGADAVKFQTHMASAESTLDEPFRVKFSLQDATRYDYWKRMEFTPEQWQGLRDHAHQKGIVFLSSAFSIPAVEMLAALDMPAWKVGSGEFRSNDLLQAMIATGKPVLFSTGMSTWKEIDEAVEILKKAPGGYALLQCTSSYPTPLEKTGLNVMEDFRARFGCVTGLSDHSGSVYPGMAAIARGADIVEAHLTLDRRMFGPDVRVSLTVGELKGLCAMRDACAAMDGHPVDKDKMADELAQMRELFTKSLAPVRDLPAGTVLDSDMLVFKKPGTGIPASQKEDILGRVLTRDVTANRLLTWQDIGDKKHA